jgi:transposase
MQNLFGGEPGLEPSVPSGEGGRVRGGRRFIEKRSRDQLGMEIRCVDDMVASDAYVRVVDAVMDELDYSAFEARYRGGGRPAYRPDLLCRLWVYAFSVGVRSARELSRRLETDLGFLWLAGEERIDHETLSDFRRRFGNELKGIFRQTVVLGCRAGLVGLGHVVIDGTKIAANAERWMKDKAGLERAIARMDEQIETLLAESEAADAREDAALGSARGDEVPKALARAETRREHLQEAKAYLEEHGLTRVSVTDPEAPLQKTQDGKRPGYNCQAGVDAEVGFIVSESVTVSQHDRQEFIPVAEQVVETTGAAPQEFGADSGYHSPETLRALEEHEDWNAYISPQPLGQNQAGKLTYRDFEYDAEKDIYRCPGGAELTFVRTGQRRGVEHRSYRSLASGCRGCEHRGRCLSEKADRRWILVPEHRELLEQMVAKTSSPEGEAARLLRKSTVERTFGVVKALMGLRQFLLRGLAGAAIEFRLAAIATNVRKLVVHWQAKALEGAERSWAEEARRAA